VATLLIIEDDADTRSTMTLLLAEIGYSVCDAADVQGATKILRAVHPDLVLLDYGLPDPQDGDGFLREKAADPDVSSIPVVVMSGYNLPPHIDGTVAVIQKPFDFELLRALIQRLIGPPQEPNTTAVA
jgi:CheY-like chemotaxis protein